MCHLDPDFDLDGDCSLDLDLRRDLYPALFSSPDSGCHPHPDFIFIIVSVFSLTHFDVFDTLSYLLYTFYVDIF